MPRSVNVYEKVLTGWQKGFAYSKEVNPGSRGPTTTVESVTKVSSKPTTRTRGGALWPEGGHCPGGDLNSLKKKTTKMSSAQPSTASSEPATRLHGWQPLAISPRINSQQREHTAIKTVPRTARVAVRRQNRQKTSNITWQ